MAYYLQKEFKVYLKTQRLKSNYEGYITTIYRKILKPNNFEILFDDLEICLAQRPDKAIGGLNFIYDFISKLYSVAKLPSINKKNKALFFINNHKMSLRSFGDYQFGLKVYITFIEQYRSSKSYTPPKGSSKYYRVKSWKDAIDELGRLFYDSISVNGMDSLMSKFSSNQDFIKYVLSNSFFFTQKMVNDQFNTIDNNINNSIPEPVPAREGTNDNRKEKYQTNISGKDTFICQDVSKMPICQILITIDKDGNKAVRDLVESETGYTTSSGINCLFTNYIISHIWGDALDPRYFTNIWNLAIVPAWGNTLLDKNNSDDTLTKELINTYKAICLKQYGMKRLKWSNIFMTCPDYDKDFVVDGTYTINVIYPKGKKTYGTIKRKEITI